MYICFIVQLYVSEGRKVVVILANYVTLYKNCINKYDEYGIVHLYFKGLPV